MREKIDKDLHGICTSCDKPQARRVDALETRQCFTLNVPFGEKLSTMFFLEINFPRPISKLIHTHDGTMKVLV